MSKRLQKRRIDDNSRQLVLVRQDRGLVNESTYFFASDSEFLFYFLLFQKKWVSRALGRWETKHFMEMALLFFTSNVFMVLRATFFGFRGLGTDLQCGRT